MEDGRRIILRAAMVSTKCHIWAVRLTRRLQSAGQALRRLAAEASRRWPAQLGYQPGGATIGLCGCFRHSKQPSTQSEGQSMSDVVMDERRVVPDLISPKKGIPLLAFGVTPDSEQLLSITLLHVPFGSLDRAYFDSPGPNLARNLLGLWPVKRRSKGAWYDISEGGERRSTNLTADPSPSSVRRCSRQSNAGWCTGGPSRRVNGWLLVLNGDCGEVFGEHCRIWDV
jgi:hypothetical protein